MSNSRYVDTAEVAKLIRQDIKRVYTDLKFSVRISRYSGGSSIRVEWRDGPTTKEIDKLVGKYSGSSFDGMIDLRSYHDSVLNGEAVHFGSDHIFTVRDYSPAFYTAAVAKVAAHWGVEPVPEVAVSDYDGSGHLVNPNIFVPNAGDQWFSSLVNQELSEPGAALEVLEFKLAPIPAPVAVVVEAPYTDPLIEMALNRAKEAFLPVYYDQMTRQQRIEEEIGLLLANSLRWDGTSVMRACRVALEDANWHSEAATLQRMIDHDERVYCIEDTPAEPIVYHSDSTEWCAFAYDGPDGAQILSGIAIRHDNSVVIDGKSPYPPMPAYRDYLTWTPAALQAHLVTLEYGSKRWNVVKTFLDALIDA